jgi:hypothetical protein
MSLDTNTSSPPDEPAQEPAQRTRGHEPRSHPVITVPDLA